MTVPEALIAFSVAAGLLTLTPGLDTALVLRTAASEGPRPAAYAAVGICLGTLGWGAAVGFGLGALLAASTLAFEILKWAGAAYLVWLGVHLIARPRERFDVAAARGPQAHGVQWLWRGALNNLLNPKAGIFYVSFLPQFIPQGVAVAPFAILLASLHVLMGLAWFAVLIGATRPIAGALQKAAVVRWLDRATGGLFLAFGVRLALERR
ncbi:MAG: LysE family translocator [Phenylobacterium sp.]|uniref:LysE family translocator n=1 Tax=Phenylobacterium sp. TaxID=1871053 RepID=UPI0025E324B8|nr:LysE family translocator [Phenylobacterium sp.]MBI1200305.1 LysE family translocator [Phenylobacterium sp.]